MPMGSFTSCPSITNSCGSTSSRRWSLLMLMALAVSTTRATSAEVTSLSFTATMPLELSPRIWLPVMPVYTRWILQSAISSASFRACWMLCTVASMFTTTPRLRPLLGATPKPASLSSPLGRTSATTAMTLAVPISSPTTTSLYSLAISVSALLCSVPPPHGPIHEPTCVPLHIPALLLLLHAITSCARHWPKQPPLRYRSPPWSHRACAGRSPRHAAGRRTPGHPRAARTAPPPVSGCA
ncbi:hypothetical protein D3C71_1102450 [compost metagenome]